MYNSIWGPIKIVNVGCLVLDLPLLEVVIPVSTVVAS